MNDDRSYSDNEINIILNRAIELQHRTRDKSTQKNGLSYSELKKIANETGVSIENLDRAIFELEQKKTLRLGKKLLGAPVTLQFEKKVSVTLQKRIMRNWWI